MYIYSNLLVALHIIKRDDSNLKLINAYVLAFWQRRRMGPARSYNGTKGKIEELLTAIKCMLVVSR